ncbi:MAG: TolC family protein [Colwellia sp.]
MKKINSTNFFVGSLVLAIVLTTSSNASGITSKALTFSKAIKVAQKNDPWLTGSFHKQQSLTSLSAVANTLPDPRVSLGFANLPTDGFDFTQEGMTQFKVGVSQMFARGDSLAIKNKQLQLKSQQQPLQRLDRHAKVAVTVGNLWLDLYQVQQSIALIEKNSSLFEQLSQLVEASYGSGFGKTRQQDIVRSQLELTRLEDKLNQLQQQQNRYQGGLVQWLNDFQQNKTITENVISLAADLPQLDLLNRNVIYGKRTLNIESLANMFAQHPSVKVMDKKIAVTKTGINLAKQKYQPQWGVNASYGYRGDDAMDNSRADFFSVGVVFDMPLFTENRQDNEVKSAISQTEAIKTEKQLLLRQLISAFVSAKGRLLRVNERQALYQEKLLPQIHDQAQASLTAYTNDDGDFAEVVRARIAQLNAEIDNLAINVKQQKIILELNYLFASEHVINIANKVGNFK